MAAHGDFRSLSGEGERGSRLPGVLMVVGSLMLPIIAWTHRPLSMRNFGEATMAAMQGDWVLKPIFFYGAFAAAAGLLVAGIVKIRAAGRS
jgi:hypothetical protein